MQEHQGHHRERRPRDGRRRQGERLPEELDDLAAVEDVCARYFTGTPAFRAVGTAALPMDAFVQIDAIFGNAEGTPPIK